ncbi:7-cyano-7-deazaguanine synthase QueC [bacterium]|nr:MAG: 7-cyano-7-deazaguanine synthase QueC [bacterium]
MSKRAVVLLSGGLDSATVLAIARERGYEVAALSFDYGQRHRVELKRAAEQARLQDASNHTVARIDTGTFAGSALTDGPAVPKHDSVDELDAGIPSTYVPARNALFLAYALAKAEVFGAGTIFLGVNALDYSGYPDCRPEFIAAFETMANLATKAAVEGRRLTIEAPLMRLDKAGIIREGLRLGVDYARTSSCYDPSPEGRPCEHCDSCLLRAKGFAEAEFPDPLLAARS